MPFPDTLTGDDWKRDLAAARAAPNIAYQQIRAKIHMNDTEILNFIEQRGAWLTYVGTIEGSGLEWRCSLVAGKCQFGGHARGATVREAVQNAMKLTAPVYARGLPADKVAAD